MRADVVLPIAAIGVVRDIGSLAVDWAPPIRRTGAGATAVLQNEEWQNSSNATIPCGKVPQL
jgi:hypothetical protein